MITVNQQSDYKLHVSVNPVEPTGEVNLLIQSTWAGAKNPDERQTVINLTLSKIDMAELGYSIFAGAAGA